MTDRSVGIEIEAVGATQDQVAAAMNAAGIPCRLASYGSPTAMHWKVQSDGSVRTHGRHQGTFELVSPVLYGDAGLEQIRRVCAVLATLNVTVNRTCGLHVHMGARNLSHDQIKRVCKRWVRDEQYVDLMMPESRRANNAHYCQSNVDGTVETMFEKIAAARTFEHLRRVMSPDRYRKLNLCAFAEHGTIEFRQHSGTVEADKICYWVEFLDSMIADAIALRSVRNRSATRMSSMTPARRVQIMAMDAGVTTECMLYMKSRAEHFFPATPAPSTTGAAAG